MKRAGITPIFDGPTLRVTCTDPGQHPSRPLLVAVLFREQHGYPGENRRRLWRIDVHSQSQFRADDPEIGPSLLALPSRNRVVSTEDDKGMTLICPQCAAPRRMVWEKATSVLDRLHAAGLEVVSLTTLDGTLRAKRR